MSDAKPSITQSVKIYGSLIIVAVVWGNAFIAIRHAVQFMTPVELAAARFTPVVILMGSGLLLSDRSGTRQLVRQDWPKVLVMALLCVTVYHLALNTGETRVPAGTASLIIATSPAVSAVLSAIFMRERLTLLRLGGLVVSFAGLTIVVMTGEGVQFNVHDLYYYVLVLLAAIVWGCYSVVGQSVLRRHSQMRVMATTLTIAGLPLMALAPLDLPSRAVAWPASVWWSVAFLSLICTAGAYVIWLNGIRHLGAARVQSFNYLIPLFAILSGVVLLGEHFSWGQAVGGALILAGVVAINRK
jgi:drug/metabolite transporter (DMT)-like permease